MKVLLATDHSPPSDEAAWLLARLPSQTPLDLKILNVVSMPYMPATVGMHPAWPRVIKALEQEAHEANQKLAHKFRGIDGDVDSVVRRGQAADEILKEATSTHPDLIVVGAVGCSALERVTLGSVSDNVATHAKCSTLVVRPTGLATDSTRSLKILVAHDGSDSSQQAIEEIAAMTWGPKTTIKLLHVMEMVDAFQADLAQSISDAWYAERESAEKDLATISRRMIDAGMHVETEIRMSAHAGESICQCAKSDGCDIVVVGDRGNTGLKRFVLGSVSRYVLRHTKSSVWICRKPSDSVTPNP